MIFLSQGLAMQPRLARTLISLPWPPQLRIQGIHHHTQHRILFLNSRARIILKLSNYTLLMLAFLQLN